MRSSARIHVVSILITIASIGCAAPRPADASRGVISLSGSLDPIRSWFDNNSARPRSLLLLSPT
ncbi:MAG: hypothetical protein HY286_08430 [Planctomycetes bacterium]|nr:hypothetical protein [Planctomycetota bacterium]